MMAIVRSWVHLLWMGVTVVPYAFALLGASVLSANGEAPYRIAQAWLRLSIHSARLLLGIEYRVQGLENLPQGREEGAVLLVKHQSTYETFLMPVIMPHPLAYVFKKELLYVPFFGWAIGRLDMIHIDRSQRARAFAKVVSQGRELLAKGVWVIMFPEGTRIPRGEAGSYKSGGARLAVATATPHLPDCRDLGQVLATARPHQAPRRGGCLDRTGHFDRRARCRSPHPRGGGLD